MNIAVIADDLTGANDTGVQMARQGLSTTVLLELKQSDFRAGAVVFDTDSRALPPAEAYKKVKTACEFLIQGGSDRAPVLYKKFDSTLRGNIGIELDAVYDACDAACMVITPSFPGAGRILKDGMLFVNGIPLHETEMAADPKHPARHSSFMKVLQQQSRHSAALISLEQLYGDRSALELRIAELRSSGIVYLVFDAVSEEDLASIVSLFTGEQGHANDVIWAGSAGLASALTTRLIGQDNKAGQTAASSMEAALEMKHAHQERLVMIVVGSVNPWSRRQLDELMKQSNVHAVVIPFEELLFAERYEAELGLIRSRVVQMMDEQRKHVALYTSGNPPEVARALKLGGENGLTEAEVGERISSELGRLAASIVQICNVRHLVLTGGDTAKKVCQQLGEKELHLIDEVESGVPLGKTTGVSDRYIITKAGAFGSDQVLVRSVNRLREGVHV